jgi:Cu/Ag efflux protein CusF
MKSITWMFVGMALLASAAWAGEWVNGEVRRVDAANAKVTIKHEELKELQMPAMTMVYTVKDAEWVKQFKPGQKVRFQAIDLGGGKLHIEAIEPQDGK